METYLRKEARRHGSSLRITNKKIEEDMAKFFSDKTISGFGKETVNMTAKEEPKEIASKKRSRKKNDDRASVSA